MRRSIAFTLLFLSSFAAPAVHAQAPAHFWSKGFGGTGYDIGYDVAVDGSGNVFMTGQFEGTVDFGRDVLVSAGFFDIFIAKYAPNGAPLWAFRFGDTSGDTGYSIATDASGNVFVTGVFGGTVDFGGGALVSVGNLDIFLAKFDSGGAHVWSKRFGDYPANYGNGLAVDGSGNVYLAASFQGTVDFGGGNLVSAGGYDVVVAKFDANGAHQWSKRFGSTDWDEGVAVAVDGSGDAFLTGEFRGSVDFGGGPYVSYSGSADLFLAKYDGTSGAHQWSHAFGDAGSELGRALATDTQGNVIATGEFQSAVDFGGGLIVSPGGISIFLLKYNTNGTHVWSQGFGSATGNDNGFGVGVDDAGNVIMAGNFYPTIDFGGGTLTAAASDGFLAKFSPNGTHVWSVPLGGNGNDVPYSVALDGAGNPAVTGVFEGPADFGGGILPGMGSGDILLAEYGRDPAEPIITSIADIGNDQGGKVKVRFNRSGHDQAASPTGITGYEIYRRDDPPPAAPLSRETAAPAPQPLIDGWSYVATAPAHGETTYGIDVPTIGDSTIASGQYYSVFFARGATDDAYTFFDSPVDSGYSLDNLAPAAPQNVVYLTGQLFWSQPPTIDFDYFTAYGGNAGDFASATVIDYAILSTLDVSSSPYTHYFVTATDFSGNESQPGSLDAATGVGGTPTSYVLSVSNFPNPFNPSTTVSYTVPVRAPVTVAIYDARGARVATLIDNEEREAGAYRMDWNGHADNGVAVSSGVYFARIEQSGAARSKKMVLLK